MFYYRRASPKRCNNMTEVEYGGGGHRTRLRNDLKDQLVCLEVPLPPYIKAQGGGGGRPRGGAPGSPTPTGSRIPPKPSWNMIHRRGKERERERERGAPPPLLVQFGLEGRGRAASPWPPLLFSTLGPCGSLTPGGFR